MLADFENENFYLRLIFYSHLNLISFFSLNFSAAKNILKLEIIHFCQVLYTGDKVCSNKKCLLRNAILFTVKCLQYSIINTERL